MAAAKSDRLHKRLHAAGLSSDICDKYVRTLRAFLQARMTKTRFDIEITTILPPDKRHVHNAIIHDLILRILHKREGVPDLPVLAPLKDKRPSTSSRPLKQLNKANPTAIADVPAKGTSSPTSLLKRPLHVSDDTRKPDNSLDSSQPDSKRPKTRPFDGAKPHLDPIMHALPLPSTSLYNTESKVSKRGKVKASAAAIADKLSSDNKKDRRQTGTPLSNNLPPPSPTVSVAAAAAAAAAAASQPPPRVPLVTSPELETYDGLSFLPSRPGAAMDFELFSKLKVRIRSLVEAGEFVGVKDDGVALLAHAVEVQVKRLLEAAITTRRRRSGKRPVGNFSCAPVRPFDLHESAVGNIDLLADESVISLERLSMLL